MATPTAYVLDNDHDSSPAHHDGLAELLDRWTRLRIARLYDRVGSHVLEVGAGGGTISHWLAREGAQVVAADLNPRHIPTHHRLTAVQVDLTAATWPDEMEGPFDLIVARLTLSHLPQRRQILHRLTERLRHGSTILVEAWAPPLEPLVIQAPSLADAILYQRYQDAAGKVFDSGGADRTWARRVHTVMAEEGLHEVDTLIHGSYWVGGGAGLRATAAVAEQLRPKLVEQGMTVVDLDRVQQLTRDPRLVVQGLPLYSTSGRRIVRPT